MALRFKNNVTITGQLTLGLNSTGQVNFANNINLNTISFKSGTTGSSATYTLPITAPTLSTSLLFSDTSGTLAWSSASTAPTFAGIKLSGTGPFSVNINSVSTNTLEDITSDSTGVFQSLLESHTNSSATAPTIASVRSHGTAALPLISNIHDALGFHSFYGYSGSSTVGYQLASQVQYWICADGTTVSTTSMPGRIQFFTTPDLSVTPSERMRINCTGTISLFGPLQMDGNRIYGDVGSSGNLTLSANSTGNVDYLTLSGSGTPGFIQIYNGQPSIFGNQVVMSYAPTYTMGDTCTNYMFQTNPTINIDAGALGIVVESEFNIAPVITHTSSLTCVFRSYIYSGQIDSVANAVVNGTYNLFFGGPTLTSSVAGVYPIPVNGMFVSQPKISAGNVNVSSVTLTFDKAFVFNPIYTCTGASSVMTSSESTALEITGNYKAATAGSALTIQSRRGVHWVNFLKTITGTVTITDNVCIDMDDQSASSGNLTVTNMYGIRSALTSGTNRFFINATGTAQSAWGGLFTKYNGITLVSNGIPSELATVDLTAQTAAISATTIYTPVATGLFRVSVYLQVTTVASVSSILGGATGVVITYNDGDGNVAQSNTVALATTAGAIAITSAGNTTATNLDGSIVIYARTGVAIKYAIGYTSSGTAMQFAAHLKVEAL